MSVESISAAAVAEARAPLTRRTRDGLGVTAAAVALGALGDALLRPAPWGANLALWTLALAAAGVGLERWTDAEEGVRVEWVPFAVGAAVLMAWRDSATLKALDLTALLVVLGLAMFRARGGVPRLAGLTETVTGLAESLFDTLAGAVRLVAKDVRWGELPRGRWGRHAAAAGRGVLIAAPLLLVFGALLVAADAAFEKLVSTTFAIDLPTLFSHLFLATVFAWAAGGVLRSLVLADARPEPMLGPRRAPPSLGVVEVATVLGLLNVLFLAFVAVQAAYLFGGDAMVTAPGTTTYSVYAKRGFFELVTVAGLVLPLLLGLHWLLRKENARDERIFRVLAGAQVALLMVIMASALHRMRLYVGAYGLTEIRLYTTAFMVWLAAVFGWFAFTVLRGRRDRFTFGALVAGLEAVVVLHAVNPDAVIVRANAARPDAAVRFDARYAASLSADAVPALLRSFPRVSEAERCQVSTRLLKRWSEPEDWRAWSLGRARARAAVESSEAVLRREVAACPVVPPETAVASAAAPSTAPAVATAPPPAPAPAADQPAQSDPAAQPASPSPDPASSSATPAPASAGEASSTAPASSGAARP
ncbi:MAG TPA: DUF4173 domain-containing protein [Longimicrobium sp.]|nr:DUF4173 domain-containing protein [Longimicrobium sp.]